MVREARLLEMSEDDGECRDCVARYVAANILFKSARRPS